MRRGASVNWAFIVGLGLLCAGWLFFASDDHLRRLLSTSTTLAAWVILFTLPLGAFLSILFSRTNLPGARAWPFVCAALLILPTYIQISGWHAIIGPVGWAQAWIPRDTSLPTVNWWSAILLHSLLALPGVVLLVSFGLSRSEAELEEIALLHWPWPLVLLRVALRRAAPLLLTAALWIFVTVCGEIAVTDIYQIRTVGEEIYLAVGNSTTATGEFPYAGLLPFLLLISLVTYSALSMADHALRVDAVVAHRQVRRFDLGRAKWPTSVIFVGLLSILLSVPLLSLFYKAGIHVALDAEGKRFQTWSLDHTWGTLSLAPREFSDILYWSFLHAAVAGTATLFLAVPLAWLQHSSVRWRWFCDLLITLLIAIPGPLVGIGLLKLLSNTGDMGVFLRDRTLFAPAAASTLRALPWILLLLRYSFQTLPEEHLELGRLQGWGRVRRLWSIALPQRWSILAAGLIFGACLCLNDVATSLLVVPPGVTLASVRMMGMLHSGVDNPLAGLALLLIGIYAMGLLGLAYLLRATERSR